MRSLFSVYWSILSQYYLAIYVELVMIAIYVGLVMIVIYNLYLLFTWVLINKPILCNICLYVYMFIFIYMYFMNINYIYRSTNIKCMLYLLKLFYLKFSSPLTIFYWFHFDYNNLFGNKISFRIFSLQDLLLFLILNSLFY